MPRARGASARSSAGRAKTPAWTNSCRGNGLASRRPAVLSSENMVVRYVRCLWSLCSRDFTWHRFSTGSISAVLLPFCIRVVVAAAYRLCIYAGINGGWCGDWAESRRKAGLSVAGRSRIVRTWISRSRYNCTRHGALLALYLSITDCLVGIVFD